MKNHKLMAAFIVVVVIALGLLFANANEQNSSQGNLPSEQAAEKLKQNEWQWRNTFTKSGEVIAPEDEHDFVLSFVDDSRFASTTDCNNLTGSYTLSDENLSFGGMTSTLMFCENSQESFYSAMLGGVEKFYISGDTLTFNLKSGESSEFTLHENHDQ